ncbi:MAG: 16S rRNA (guanine(966)-N(2))-methyltransferase RsmD [Deltaproteobacteria bacterium]
MLTGTLKGARLKVPKGSITRPTTSRVKKTIFDTLRDVEGARVLDIFSGSGSLGIESLSREALRVTFIEKNPLAVKALKENLERCRFQQRAEVICAHYESAVKKLLRCDERFDLIFIDPPYSLYDGMKVEDFILAVSELLGEGGVIVIEHNYKTGAPAAGFRQRTKPFGGTQLSFFTRDEE